MSNLIKPTPPERYEGNDQSRFVLIKAMGVAIAAISKEKEVFISEAEVKRNSDDYFEMTIRCTVPEDKEKADKYNKALREYYTANEEYNKKRIMEKFGINETEFKKAESEWYEYCKNTSYSSRLEKETWYEANHPFIKKAPVIEVQ